MSSELFVCPVPQPETERILLGHGSGGRLSHQLLESLIFPAFANPTLERRDDQAVLSLAPGRIAFSTDSFVVTPPIFPGGDIGTLAVHGTVNDLAMAGARPLYLSVALILEEGLPIAMLERILGSMRDAAQACGVQVVTGDTKVVERGAVDQLFINTTGIGLVPEGRALSSDQVRDGDAILLSGTLADHGLAVMSARQQLGLEGAITSDTAPLHDLVEALFASGAQVRCLRDPTRGGLGAALSEIASRSKISLEVQEPRLPIAAPVRGACELLGLDPLFIANEGKLVAFVAAEDADRALSALRGHPLGKHAALIGRAFAGRSGEVLIRTALGGARVLDLPFTDPLPRIC
jgi:hydrogenase expression/formation protein HypE